MTSTYALGLILALSLVPSLSTVHATGSPNVFLSEINWAGSSKSTADEWLELSNAGGTVTDIGGWQLTGVGTSGSNIIIPANTLLDVNQTYLIANYALGDPKTTLTIAPNLITTAVSIPNTSLKITVLDASGTIIDTLTDSGTPDFGSSLTFISMERNSSSLLWQNTTTSMNLDGIQLGSPGVFTPVPIVIETPAPTIPSIIETPPVPSSPTIIETPTVQAPPVETLPEIIPPTEALVTTPSIETTPAPIIITEPIAPIPIITEAPITETPVEILTPPIILEDPSIPGIPTESSTSLPQEPEPTPIIEIPEEAPLTPVIQAEIQVSPTASESSTSTIDATNTTYESNTTNVVTTEPLQETLIPTSEQGITLNPPTLISPGDLIVSELLPSPSTGFDEWVELENMTNSVINLDGLTLVDASGKVTTLTGSIDANGFILITNPSGKLNNDGDSMTFMNVDASVLDTISYGTDNNPAPKKDESFALVNGVWIVTTPTPGTTNIAPIIATIEPEITDTTSSTMNTPTVTPIISSTPYANTNTMATTTPTNGTNVSQKHTTTRNNSIGTTHVASGTQAITTIHPTTKSPTSITLKTSSATTKTKTKKKSSTKKSRTTTTQSITIDDIPTLADKTKVSITGIVITTPGLIGKRSFFIDGLEIYQGTGALADIHIGDEITITGTLSVLSDHRRVNIAEGGITILNHTEPTVQNYTSSLPFGSLVRITGTVSARDGDGILLKTKDTTVKIMSATGVVIDWASFAGANVTATGILKHGDQETITLRRTEDLAKDPETTVKGTGTIAGTTGSSSGFSSLWFFGGIVTLASTGFGTWVWFTRPKHTKSLLTLHPTTV